MHKLTILFVLSIFLSGCGQKGPLYHSQAAPEKNKSVSEQPIPESELTKDKR